MNGGDYNKRQEDRKTLSMWIKILLLILILILIGFGFYMLQPKKMKLTDVVEAELSALRKNQLVEAYQNYTSEEFRSKISLQDFETFIKNNPALANSEVITYQGHSIEKDRGTLVAIVSSKTSGSSPIIFKFIKENGKWKISNIQVLESHGLDETQPKEIAQADIEKEKAKNGKVDTEESKQSKIVIEEQLKALKKDDITKAYNDYTSSEFREFTSLDTFKDFIHLYPEFMLATDTTIEGPEDEEGRKLYKVFLQTDKGKSEIEYRLVQEDGKWKVWGILLIKSSLDYTLDDKDKKNFQDIIQKQLNAVKEDKIDKSYTDYTSTDFRDATSLNDYKEFLDSYPIFKEEKKITIKTAQMKGSKASIRVALESPEMKTDVDYVFIKDGDQWKIWGIQVAKELPLESEKESKEKVLALIRNQLQALKDKDFSKAYYAYTSTEFQDASPYNVFMQFIDDHPVLTEVNNLDDVQIKDSEIDLERMFVVVDLDKGEKPQQVEYNLVKENDKWKVYNLKIITEGETSEYKHSDSDKKEKASDDEDKDEDKDDEDKEEETESKETSANNEPLEFTKVSVGTKVDLTGMVSNPTTTFKPDSGEITANIWVENGHKDDTIEVELHHVESDSSIPPISTKLDKDGESVVSFIFSPPSQGWPEGDYELKINSSTGAEKTYEINVAEE